jgi:pyruvate,water dikinase
MEKGVQKSFDFIKWFSEIGKKDIPIAGGKGANLGEMYNSKFPVPPGFVITAQAYDYFIDKAGIKDEIINLIKKVDKEDTDELNKVSRHIRELIEKAEMPKEMQEAILEAYEILDVDKKGASGMSAGAMNILRHSYEPPFVAVRSSATTEDLATASFAGQQETFLNVKGEKELIHYVKKCFSSLFTARAVYYRDKKNFKEGASLAVVIQKMINSDKSGVMFSQNPVKNDNSIMIEAVWGLGEGIVSGRIKPDTYVISGNLEDFEVVEHNIAEKKIAIVREASGRNKIVNLTETRSKQQVLTGHELKMLANYARKLEEHYEKPQDIEFAILDNDLFIVQTRPITTKAIDKKKDLNGKVLLSGLGASPGSASGVVKIVKSMADLGKVKKGDVLVTVMTNPDMVVTMQKAAAIVTNEGGITSHAAIVSREMGIPAVVGTDSATEKLQEGQVVTVDGSKGRVFDGKVESHLAEVQRVVESKTKIKVIVDLPDYAERAAKSGCKAVGLTRLEGIIAEGGKHPLYYSKEKKYEDYTSLLFKGLKKIAVHFNEMWIRSSDIRSDEYMHLEGASKEIEGNPMLGNHGIRFSLKYSQLFKAEIEAVKKLALEYPDKKFGIMMPQVISLEEVEQTKKIVEKIGVPENIILGIMVETPAAVQIINQLCEAGIKFVSFGTNDLTQYILAIDRNNENIQKLYDEMNPAVLSAISYVIRRCKKYGVETSICGQAGSKEEMVKFLIQEGIDSISVNADAAYKVSQLVQELEKNVIKYVEVSPSNDSMTITMSSGKKKQREEILVDYVVAENAGMMMDALDSVMNQPIPIMQAIQEVAREDKENKDMEDIVLEELEKKEDYKPGDYNSSVNEAKKDIPLLNDSIPVDSDMVENQ